MEIDCDPIMAPQYYLNVVVGVGEGAYDEYGRASGVPAWYLLPETTHEEHVRLWRFTSPHELKNALNRILEEVIEPHIRPLWESTELLEKCTNEFSKYIKETQANRRGSKDMGPSKPSDPQPEP